MRLALAMTACSAFALVPATARAAELPTVLVLGHSPDGVAIGGLLSEVAAALERRGITAIDPGEAAAKLPDSSRQDVLAAAQAAIAEGERAYLELELPQAKAQLESAIVRLDATDGPQAVSALVLALERSALVQLALGEGADAAATLDRLYRVSPGHRPDSTLVSPRFAPAFDEAAKRARGAATRPVRIVSVPEGAEIYVDGRPAGVAPVPTALTDGAHRIEARLSGHAASVSNVAIGGGVSEIPVRLAPPAGDTDRGEAIRDVLAASVLPGRRERFIGEVSPRVGAGAALVITVRRGSAPAADLYRAGQPAVSLDRVEGATSPEAADAVASFVDRRLRPAPVAAARPPVVKDKTARPAPWVWIAGFAVLSAGAGAAYASSTGAFEGDEKVRNEEGTKTVRFGGAL